MFTIANQPVTGDAATLHYMDWCLALEQEHADVPHNALDALSDFQHGAFQGDQQALARINLSGIEVRR